MRNKLLMFTLIWVVSYGLGGCCNPVGDKTLAPHYTPSLANINAINLLPNSSFELGSAGWASLGESTGWVGDLSGLHGDVQTGQAREGDHCLHIEMGPDITPVTYADCWPPVRVVQHAPLAANVGWIPVQVGKLYTLSAYIRSDLPGTKATLMFRYAGNPLTEKITSQSKTILLTTNWQRYSFTTKATTDALCIAIGPEMSTMPEKTANFWFDALKLEQAPSPTEFSPREPIEISIETAKYGNTFSDTESPALKIHGRNITQTKAVIPITIELEDYSSAAFPPQTVILNISPGKKSTANCKLKIPGKGFYKAKVNWTVNGNNHNRSIRIAVIKPYKRKDSCFGVNHAPSSANQLSQLSKAGVTWTRNWAHNWQWIEPVEKQINYEPLDCHIDRLLDSGMNVVSLLPSNPSTNWSSTAPDDVEPTLWHRMAYAPKDPQKLYNFITQSVNRYKDRETYWEFLNEPLWIPDFCLPESVGYTVGDYLKLLKGAHSAMKSADPNCKVVGGLSIKIERKLGDSFINAGGLDYVDIYNLHPYPGFNTPEFFIEHLTRIQTVMDANGPRKPIWATECGYYAADDKPWEPWIKPEGNWAARWQLESEKICADYLCRFSIIYLAHGVKKLFWHQSIEGPVNDSTMNMSNCLLTTNATPRKFYPVQSALSNMLGPNPQCAGAIKFPSSIFGDNTDRLFGYAFQCGDRAVLAAWASEGSIKTDNIKLNENIKIFDIMGNSLNRLNAFDVSPVYMVATANSAEDLKTNWFQGVVKNQKITTKPKQTKMICDNLDSNNLITNSIGMKLVYISPGEFLMGSHKEKLRSSDEGPQHNVKITKGFWMGQCEVTQQQYQAVMGNNPSHFKGKSLPVDTVSWNEAQAFCKKLSQIEGRTYRLPTEAQWEYACRGGSQSRFSFGDNDSDLDKYAWHGGLTTHSVGQKNPNSFGLCDMHGNVWEWCADLYEEGYKNAGNVDPVGPIKGYGRVLRGGAWNSLPVVCRSAYRFAIAPDGALNIFGFRVILEKEELDNKRQNNCQGRNRQND